MRALDASGAGTIADLHPACEAKSPMYAHARGVDPSHTIV